MGIRKRVDLDFSDDEPEEPAIPAVNLDDTTFKAMGVPKDQIRATSSRLAHSDLMKDPRSIKTADLVAMVRSSNNPGDVIEKRYRDRISSPLTAIRAYCVLCSNGPKMASKCDNTECPIWLFRYGKNPFFMKRNS